MMSPPLVQCGDFAGRAGRRGRLVLGVCFAVAVLLPSCSGNAQPTPSPTPVSGGGQNGTGLRPGGEGEGRVRNAAGLAFTIADSGITPRAVSASVGLVLVTFTNNSAGAHHIVITSSGASSDLGDIGAGASIRAQGNLVPGVFTVQVDPPARPTYTATIAVQ